MLSFPSFKNFLISSNINNVLFQSLLSRFFFVFRSLTMMCIGIVFLGGVSLSASIELLCKFISLGKSGEFCSFTTFSAPLSFNSPGILRIQILHLLLLFRSPLKFFSLFYAVHFLSVTQSGQFLFSTLKFTDSFCSPLRSVIDSIYYGIYFGYLIFPL